MTLAYAQKLKQSEHPPSFVCPLSYRVMEDPVSDLCGHTFERTAIEAWIARGNSCCPISRKSLTIDDLKLNHFLAERIDKWKWEKEHEDLTVLKSAAHTRPDDDEVSADGEVIIRGGGDIEMGGHILPKTGFKRNYQEVPTGMTLLPQEREALEVIRKRNSLLKRRRERRKCFYCSVGVATVLIFVGIMGAYWLRRYDEAN